MRALGHRQLAQEPAGCWSTSFLDTKAIGLSASKCAHGISQEAETALHAQLGPKGCGDHESEHVLLCFFHIKFMHSRPRRQRAAELTSIAFALSLNCHFIESLAADLHTGLEYLRHAFLQALCH